MVRFLADQSIDFEFVDAITSSEITENPTRFHPSVLACFFSHKRTLEWASKQGEPTLILEDDAWSNREVTKEIEKLLATDQKWDIILLGWISKSPLQEVNSQFVKSSNFILAHAYIVNPVGAKRILSFLRKAGQHFDVRLAELGRNNIVRVLLAKDQILYQGGHHSQIPKARIKNKKKYENKLKKVL